MTQNYMTFLAIAAITTVNACLLLYNMIIKYNIAGLLLKKFNPGKAAIFFFEKASGLIIFGVIPYLLLVLFTRLTSRDAGLTFRRLGEHSVLVAFSIIAMLILSYFVSGIKQGGNKVSVCNISELTPGNVIPVVTGWMLYLLGYEFMFRGILWFVCVWAFGLIPSLAINLLLYALAHINQGTTKILGSIPAGILFCLFSYLTGSFILAFLVHTTMAVSYELFLAYHTAGIKVRPVFKNQRQ
jgi:membrane protease YdiL (CAAX protease family)